MDIRYDFQDKLDLIYFRKQITNFIEHWTRVVFKIYLKDYLVRIELYNTKVSKNTIIIELFHCFRNSDNEIISQDSVYPARMTEFNGFPMITDLFKDPMGYPVREATLNYGSVEGQVDTLCEVIKTCHKLNKIKAFQ
jgi:hypothetical protein